MARSEALPAAACPAPSPRECRSACQTTALQGPTCVDYLALKGPLPKLPPGWKTAACFTERELVGQLHDALTDANPDVRASAARRLAQANTQLLSSPLLGRTL